MATQIQATILKIGTAPILETSQSWSFPTDEIAIESVINGDINSCILWGGIKYYAEETQSELVTAANVGGDVTIPSTAYATNAEALAALGAGQLYKSTTSIEGSPIILITV